MTIRIHLTAYQGSVCAETAVHEAVQAKAGRDDAAREAWDGLAERMLAGEGWHDFEDHAARLLFDDLTAACEAMPRSDPANLRRIHSLRGVIRKLGMALQEAAGRHDTPTTKD